MSLYENHATDKKFEKTGVWVDYGGFRVKIAKAGGANRKYTAMVERETKPLRRAMQAGTLSEDRAKPIMIKVFIKTIILGWQTFVDSEDLTEDQIAGASEETTVEDGGLWVSGIEQQDKSIEPFNDENLEKVLTDLPAVFNMIKEDALADDIFKQTMRQEEAKNS